MSARVLVLTFISLLTLSAHAQKTWKTSDNLVTLKAPEGFQEMEKTQELSTLELYDPSLNIELVVSRRLQSSVPLDTLSEDFAAMIEAQGGSLRHKEMVRVNQQKALLFQVANLGAEGFESLYLYLPHKTSGSVGLVMNYPAPAADKARALFRSVLQTVKLSTS